MQPTKPPEESRIVPKKVNLQRAQRSMVFREPKPPQEPSSIRDGAPSAPVATEPKPLRFRCPHCDVKLSGDAAYAGAVARCGHCHKSILLPPVEPAAGTSAIKPAVPEFLVVDMKLRCPACQAKFNVDSRASGRRLPCPTCAHPLAIPRLPPYPRLASKVATSTAGPAAKAAPPTTSSLTAEEIGFLMAPETIAGGTDASQAHSA